QEEEGSGGGQGG
nr:Chain B, Protein AMBP [Homo sapiens]